MKTIIVLAGSTNSKSINRQLAVFAGLQLEGYTKVVLDLNNFAMPIYSSDVEERSGIPPQAVAFAQAIASADGVILSLAEHNGSYSAAFKNVFDWASRHAGKVWAQKPMLLMATSPGARGGSTVLETAAARFPFNGGNVVATFSLPSFNANFAASSGITNAELLEKFNVALNTFRQAIGS